MKKILIFATLIIIVILGISLIQFATPKTGSLEINLINPDDPYLSKVNVCLLAGSSDSPESLIIQKIEGVNSPGTITLNNILPGEYRISSRTNAYQFRMIFPDCNECNYAEIPIVEITAGKTTKVTIQTLPLTYS
jgi:hypothetical protein